MRYVLPVILATALAIVLDTNAAAVRAQGALPAVSRACQTILKIIGVVSASKVAEEAGISVKNYWQDTAPPGESIYSVRFHFTEGTWDDWFSKPDIFMVVEYEGGKSVLIPDIENNWNYQEKIYTFRCPTMPARSHCVLRLYDDDSTSNAAWNKILSTPINWKVSAAARSPVFPKQGVRSLEATMQADGTFQILDSSDEKRYQIDTPDQVANASLTVPTAGTADKWDMEGRFVKDGKPIGTVRLTHWFTNDGHRLLSYVRPALLFWITLAVGVALLLWKKPWETVATDQAFEIPNS